MTTPLRRRYVVGAVKIPYAQRDVVRAVLTEDDDREFFPIAGALDDTADYRTAPVGAEVSYRVELTDEEAERFRAASNCRYVHLDGHYELTADIPRAASLAFMEANFPTAQAWSGAGVAVAILDSGTTTAMRAALGISLGGKTTFISDGPPAQDGGQTTGSHGCAVASCGVPAGGVVYDVLINNNSGGILGSNIAAGINWALDQGVKVINGSFGGSGIDLPVRDAIERGLGLGAQFFFAAGNAGANTLDYPAAFSTSYTNVHSSINFNEATGTKAASSNFSASASGCAPGENVAVLTTAGAAGTASGTSMSSPHMASLCARGMTGGRFTAAQVGAALKANTRNTGQPAAQQGGGAYSLNRALTALGAFAVTNTPFPYVGFLDGVAYPAIGAGGTTVNVSTSSALTTALANADPGQRIVLASGTYSGAFTLSSKVGTATAPISVEAASTGGAIFASGSTFSVTGSSAYITLKGLSFPYELASGNTVQFRDTSHHCRVTRCLFGPAAVGTPGANKTPYIFLSGTIEHVRIDHNELRNKANPGNAILGDGNFTTNQAVRHIRIDHNYIHDIRPEVDNEKEPIRLGVSTMSKTMSYSVIERNVFVGCICEPEVISVKCGGVRVTGNTVLRSIGGIVYRHGTGGVVNDNYTVDRVATFGTTIGSGGIRFYDANHEVSHNYVDGVYGGNFQNALMLDSGDAEGSSTNLAGHWRVVNALVERNVLVGNPTGVVFGHNYSLAPSGCTVRDNLVASAASGTAVTQKIAPVSTTQTGNLYGSTPSLVGLTQTSDTIWRRSSYGPRLTYLQSADVGITGDPADTDGTGTLVGSDGGGGGGSTTPPDPAPSTTPVGITTTFTEGFELGNFSRWTSVQNHAYEGSAAGYNQATTYSHRIVSVDADHPHALRTEVRDGDTAVGSHERAELSSFGKSWNDNLNDERWYEFDVRFGDPTWAPTWSGGTNDWLIFFQSHAENADGAPPLALAVRSDNKVHIQLEPDDVIQPRIAAWTVRPGVWEKVVLHVKWSPNPSVGFVQLHVNGVEIVPKTFRQTQYTGDTNNQYVKLGTYRRSTVSGTTVVMHDNVRISGPPVSTALPTTAGEKFAWGAPLDVSDEFGYTGAPNSSKWSMYNGPGHSGNGRRVPARATVDGSTLVGTGLSNGDSFGMAHRFDQRYGRWEVRMRSYQNAASNGNDYHPVLIIWPESDEWPEDGEYDFVENSVPGDNKLGAFIHFPHDDSPDIQQRYFEKSGVDMSQFHNFAIEWTPDHIKGFVDGEEWFSTSGGARTSPAPARRNIQDMPSGHLTIQLDNFDGTSQTPATMEVAWVRVYTLTPSGGTAGPQAVTAFGITSREAIGAARVTVAAPPDVPVPPPANSVPTLLGQNTVLGAMTLGWTLTTGGPTPGQQTVSGAGGIGTGQGFGVPSLNVPPGDQVVVPVGISPPNDFGRPTVLGGIAPPPAPGGVLVPALFAVGTDGVTLTPLPHWQKMHLSPVRNSAGSLSIDYPYGAPGFDLLASSVSANPLRALEIRVWLGGNNTAALGGWLVQKSGDDTTRGAIWTFSGHFHEWLLSKAIVAPQPISEANTSGALIFAGATAGLILATAMDQAQARGALPLVTRDFTATHDSNGQPWAKEISSAKFAPKTTITQIADKLVELAMCEYGLTPARMFRAFNPEGNGNDRSTGLDPLSFDPTQNLKERTHRESSRDAGTAVLVAGSEGFYKFVSSPTAQAQLGWRAEVGVDAGQLTSQSAVDAVAPTYLEAARSGVAEYSAGVVFTSGRLPLIDYGVGDWALVRTGTQYQRHRIAQIELDFAPGEPPSGSVEFNDLITDRVTALYRRLNAISTGDAVVGTSEPTPGGAGDDIIPPAAPTGVVVSSTNAYRVPGETLTLAEVSVGWAPVTADAYADAETAGKAQLAVLLAARLRDGLRGEVTQESLLASDWTFYGQPSWAPTYAPLLKQEWVDDPAYKDEDTGNAVPGGLLAWLTAYEPAHRGGGAITADVARYVVQYQYLGVTVGGSDGTTFDPLNPNDNGFWETPDNSPTTQNTLVFGNVEGGRALGVRVAAVDRSGNQGPWSAVVAVDTAEDDQPPPTPSKPIASAWFRTMDVTWDGKGSSGEDMILAAPDFLSGGGLEVHVATGIDFTPHRPTNAAGAVDLAASSTYRTTMYAAGTSNITGLSIGTTYYARFVAVDRSGNASPPSETSDGVLPQQLVNIDIGPDAIGRAQIIDGEIVRAKIADAAINSLKVEEINVGLLRSGTMTANVIIGGRFETPMINGNKVEVDNAGIRLWQGNTVVGRWQVADASMLVTGTYLSGLLGERINILPDGSFRMYGAAGADYASFENAGGVVRMRSRADSAGRRAYVDFDPTGFRAYYGTVGGQIRSLFYCEQTYGVINAPVTGVRIYRHIAPTDGTTPRFHFVTSTATGDDSASIVHLERVALASNHAYLFGATANAGIVFDTNFIGVTFNNINPAPIHASSFVQVSAIEAKRDIAPVQFGARSARRITQLARARQFYYRSDFVERAEKPDAWLQRFDEEGNRLPDVQADWTGPQRRPVMHVGPMADDLVRVAPEIVHTELPQRGSFGGAMGLGIGTVAGLAWAAAGELADEVDELRVQLAELRARLDGDDEVVEGEVV